MQAKADSFWTQINWRGYLRPQRFEKDRYSAAFIDRIVSESIKVVSTAEEFDSTFCAACIQLAGWPSSALIDEAFLKTLAVRLNELKKNAKASEIIQLPMEFTSYTARPEKTGFTAERGNHVTVSLSSRRDDQTIAMFPMLSLVKVLEGPLPSELHDSLRAILDEKVDTVREVASTSIQSLKLQWPQLDLSQPSRGPISLRRKPREFWYDIVVGCEARLLLEKHGVLAP